jgi:hypothetical protein
VIYAMNGLEVVTLELFATLSAYDAAARTAPLDPSVDENGRGYASLLIFQLKGLKLWWLPGVDYSEALWRVKVKHQGADAWLAVACDIDEPLPRAVAARLVRYPTRAAELSIVTRADTTVKVGDGFEATLSETGEQPTLATLPLVVARGPQVFTVPFGTQVGKGLVRCGVKVAKDALWKKTFGASARVSSGQIQWERPHECGLARRA